MKRAIAVGLGLLWTSLAIAAPPALPAPKVLDDFDDIGAWKLVLSDQVSGSLRPVSGAGGGRALCLDYDFHKVSGYVGIRRALNIDYPVNYRFGFQLRGDSPANDLQFKLIDASGDNVWWVNRPGYSFPKAWTPVEYRRRQIDKAWGPSPEKEMARSAAVEFTIYSKVGGRGTVCFDKLTLQGLPPQDDSALVPSVIADTATALQDRMIDGKGDTFWISGGVKQQTISLDLNMEFDIRKAGESDDIADTLDYKAVSKRLIQFVEASEFQLVEALAEHCARIVLTEFPVKNVELKLSKPGAVRGSSAVGVMIERSAKHLTSDSTDALV